MIRILYAPRAKADIERVADFSALYEMDARGNAVLIGLTVMVGMWGIVSLVRNAIFF